MQQQTAAAPLATPVLDVTASAAHALASLYRVAAKLRTDALPEMPGVSEEILRSLELTLSGPLAAAVFAAAFKSADASQAAIETGQREGVVQYPAVARETPEVRAHYDWQAGRIRWARGWEARQSTGQSAASFVCSAARCVCALHVCYPPTAHRRYVCCLGSCPLRAHYQSCA